MPFQKGNKLATVQKGKPKAKTQAWKNIVSWLVGSGGIKFKDLIEKLSLGEEISKEEEKFLQHFKDLLEYHQPKLARTEVTGKNGKPFTVNNIHLLPDGKQRN